MKKVIFIEYCNATPHIETSLEIAKLHLEQKDKVYWYFWGHQVPFSDWMIPSNHFPPLMTPERRGIRCLKNNNLYTSFRMPKNNLIHTDMLNKRFNNIDELIEFKWNGIDIGVGLANSLISKIAGTPLDMSQYQELIQQMIKSYLLSFQATIETVNKIYPDHAYVFNGRFCCQHATASALKQLNIPVYYHERGADRNRYHIRNFAAGDRGAYQEMLLKVWQDAIKKNTEKIFDIGRSFFISNRRGVEQGWLAFNANQKKNKLPGFPKGKRIISYFHSSDDEYLVRNKIFKNKPWSHQVNAFQALIDGVAKLDEYHLVVRLHPHLALKNKKDKELWVNYSLPKNCTLIEPESDIDSYSLIEASEIVFTYGSTVGIESVYWGTPSVLLGNSNYDRLSGVLRITSKEHLLNVLKNGVTLPKENEVLAYGYYMKTFGTNFKFYESENLFKGKFMGKNLQYVPLYMKWIKRFWWSL